MSTLALQLRDVRKSFGPTEIIRGVSLDIPRGQRHAIIGPNGAGKTTLFNLISGRFPMTSGDISLNGESLKGVAPHLINRKGLSRSFQITSIFPRMTVLENLMMGAYTRNDKAAIAHDLERVYTLFDILKKRSAQLGGTLSGGEQQMLAIGRAILSRPRLLMMDEPSMGIAPLLVAKIFEAVRELNRGGLTILLVEQNARAALKLAHRGSVLETGRVILADDAKRLLDDPRVRESYLGE